MRVAVVGAGGTGGYFGGLLAHAGEDVTFIARGAHGEAIAQRGLTIKAARFGERTIRAHVTDDPSTVGPVDLVLFCVKAYDTVPAAEAARPLIGPETMLLSVQNGIANEDRIAGIVGSAPVMGAIAGLTASIAAPGVITVTEPAWLRFGELAGGTSPRAERLLDTLQRTEFKADLVPDIRALMWEKLLFICAFSGVCSLARLNIGPILACPETRELYRGVMAEVEAVARAHGIPLAPNRTEQWLAFTEGIPSPHVHGSMYDDLTAGRRLEVEWLNGTVVKLGAEPGVPTPLNFAIYAALKPYADGQIAPK